VVKKQLMSMSVSMVMIMIVVVCNYICVCEREGDRLRIRRTGVSRVVEGDELWSRYINVFNNGF